MHHPPDILALFSSGVNVFTTQFDIRRYSNNLSAQPATPLQFPNLLLLPATAPPSIVAAFSAHPSIQSNLGLHYTPTTIPTFPTAPHPDLCTYEYNNYYIQPDSIIFTNLNPTITSFLQFHNYQRDDRTYIPCTFIRFLPFTYFHADTHPNTLRAYLKTHTHTYIPEGTLARSLPFSEPFSKHDLIHNIRRHFATKPDAFVRASDQLHDGYIRISTNPTLIAKRRQRARDWLNVHHSSIYNLSCISSVLYQLHRAFEDIPIPIDFPSYSTHVRSGGWGRRGTTQYDVVTSQLNALTTVLSLTTTIPTISLPNPKHDADDPDLAKLKPRIRHNFYRYLLSHTTISYSDAACAYPYLINATDIPLRYNAAVSFLRTLCQRHGLRQRRRTPSLTQPVGASA